MLAVQRGSDCENYSAAGAGEFLACPCVVVAVILGGIESGDDRFSGPNTR